MGRRAVAQGRIELAGPPFSLGDDCELRLLDESDADELHALVERNRDYLGRWMPWAPAQTMAGTVDFLRTSRAQAEADNGYQLAIVREGRIAGVAGFHGLDRRNCATTIGYWLAEDEQGRGTMTRAVRALVDHAFADLGMNRVEIRVAPGNQRSRAVPERLGFREEGLLREAERHGDRYLDLVVYAVLAREWS